MKKIILFLLVLIAFTCTKQTAPDKQQEEEINPFHTPYKQYVIQPYNMSIEEGNKFEKYLRTIGPFEWSDISVVYPKKLDDSFDNPNHTRFQAQKILNWQKKNCSYKETCDSIIIVIGYIHDDISIPLHGKSDWGIQGLGSIGKYQCLVSDFRIKNKNDLWKITLHEIGHAYGLNHCPNNSCIMQDCKGKPNWKNKKWFCNYCDSIWNPAGLD